MGWPLSEIKVRYPRDRFFSRANRQLVAQVNDLTWQFDADDLATSQHKLTFSFSLPRGSYATMVVKQIMLDVPSRGIGKRLHDFLGYGDESSGRMLTRTPSWFPPARRVCWWRSDTFQIFAATSTFSCWRPRSGSRSGPLRTPDDDIQ